MTSELNIWMLTSYAVTKSFKISLGGAEIQKMLTNKTAVMNGGFEFNYVSILIGASSSAPTDLINKELQGSSSTFVHATHNSTDDPLKTGICFV